MENKNWLIEMLGDEVIMKGNILTFGKGSGLIENENRKDLGLFVLNVEEQSITSCVTDEKFYPKSSEELGIIITKLQRQKSEKENNIECVKSNLKMEQLQIKLEALKLTLQMQGGNQAPSATSLVKEAKIIEQYIIEK